MTKFEFPKGKGPKIEITSKTIKPDITLLDTGFLKGLAYVMMDGADRPGRRPNSWQDLSFDDAMKRLASAYRHLLDVHDGEYYDKDSGLQNAYHLAANAMIVAYHINKRFGESE